MRKEVDSSLPSLARDCSRSIDHVDRNHELGMKYVRSGALWMGFRYSAAYSLLFASLSEKYELSDQSFFTNEKKRFQAFVGWLAVLDG